MLERQLGQFGLLQHDTRRADGTLPQRLGLQRRFGVQRGHDGLLRLQILVVPQPLRVPKRK